MNSKPDMSVGGDDDRWMLLRRLSGGDQPIVIRTRINPNIHDFARSNAVTAVICDVEPALVSAEGMPQCTEALYDLEDRLVLLIAGLEQKAFCTASATGDGRRTIYFAHDIGVDIDQAASGVPCDVASVSATRDFDFETYDDFISPTALDVQIDGDHAVISSLRDNGDDGTVPRKIDFWFYGERPSLEQLVSQVSALRLSVDRWLNDDQEGVILTSDAPATLEHFEELTPALVQRSNALGIVYDGWETFVVGAKQPPEVTPQPSNFLSRIFGRKKP